MAISTHWGRHARPLNVPIRHVGIARPAQWLARGWHDLVQHWRISTVYGGLLACAGWVLLLLGSTHPYFIAAAITCFLLVAPVMTTGICELSRRTQTREPIGFDESLEGFTRNRGALLEFGGLLAAIALLWLLLSEVLLRTMLGTGSPDLDSVLWGGFLHHATNAQILAYVLIGGALAALVFALSAVSIPLMIDRHASATDAMRTSVRAVWANLPAMLLWSAMLVVITAVGFATLLFGMIWIAPLLGAATWHAYRDLVG